MGLRLGAAASLMSALALSCGDSRGAGPAAGGPGSPARLAIEVARADGTAVAPFALTASDGTGLILRDLVAKVVIDPPLAFTQIELAFQNPEARRIEGRLELALPERASVSRLALQIGGAFQEGEVVERPRAVAAYEEALHQRRDPALLERDAGNKYRMRVFPIEQYEVKRVIVAYSEIISGGAAGYRLPLSGLPVIDRVRAEVSDPARGESTVLERERWQPEGDLVVPLAGRRSARAVVSGSLALLHVTPALQSRAAPIERLTVLFDTSASAAVGFERRIAQLRALLAAIAAARGGPFPVQLVVFDQQVVPLLELRSDQLDGELEAQLLARGAFGATDFAAALRGLAQLSELGDRVMAYTDGVATAGASDHATLAQHVAALQAHGVRRFDVVTYGSVVDRPMLEALAHAELPEAGVVVPDADPQAAAVRLLRGTERRVAVEIAGAEWTYPRELRGVEPGASYPIFAQLRDAHGVTLRLGGEAVQLQAMQTVARPLLEREWARARIEQLEQEGAGERSEADAAYARERIVALSTRHRVLSDATAWVVLESEQDYARHGIERARAARLIVRDGALVASGEPEQVAGARADEPSLDDAPAAPADEPGSRRNAARDQGIIGLIGPPAGIGTIGHGAGGARDAPASAMDALGTLSGDVVGRSSGFGMLGTGRYGATASGSFRSRRGITPLVVAGKSDVRGSLSKEVVRRIVQRHINEVRFCYELALNTRPQLAGAVTVKWIISPVGSVQTAAVSASSVGDAQVERCIANAVRRWSFPAPEGGGVVVVTYPFTLDPVHSDGPRIEPDDAVAPATQWTQARRAREQRARMREWRARARPLPADALTGPLLEVTESIAAGRSGAALARARQLARDQPHDLPALLALARAASAAGDRTLAARAYGSLIDLFPSRAELRRAAGQGLEQLGADGLALAIDSYRRAVAQRPDHPAGHRLLGLALWRAGDRAAGRESLERGRDRGDPLARFPGVTSLLREDAQLAASRPPAQPWLRICVYWENDATDVDLIVYDGSRQRAGGEHFTRDRPSLSADVATGFGPECVTATGAQIAFPYLLQVHYAARGAMGYALGAVHVLQVDAQGAASFEMRPFVLMKEGAVVELGSVLRPTS